MCLLKRLLAAQCWTQHESASVFFVGQIILDRRNIDLVEGEKNCCEPRKVRDT